MVLREERYLTKPSPAKPSNVVAQVEDQGIVRCATGSLRPAGRLHWGSIVLKGRADMPFNVELFLGSPHPETREVGIATIAGVGSSALGSAAFAWDISTATRKPVLAIVPGYGVADVVLQGLGGWFGFGLYNYLHAKSLVQNALASTAPKVAEIGRNLSAST